MRERAPSISVGSNICDACRKKLAEVPTTLSSASEIESESEVYVDIPESLASINQCLGKMGETPVSKTKLKPVRKIQSEFCASNYMARKVKDLVRENGILATPNPKPGHLLASEVVDLVSGFYSYDDVSRMMPGKKDFVSVKQGEQRVHIQK